MTGSGSVRFSISRPEMPATTRWLRRFRMGSSSSGVTPAHRRLAPDGSRRSGDYNLRMRRSVLAALIVVSTVPGTQARTSPAPGQAEAVRSIFAPVTGAPERPSAAVAWITEGADAEFAFFGRADLGAPDAPDAQTFYEIGSITKGLTGIILADMARAGEIGIHDRLEALLPDGESMPEAIRRITLAQLATHSSGLPRMPGNIIVGITDPLKPVADSHEAPLLAFLRNYKAPVANTITPEYSNLGFG